jgi:hypothetical protein
MQLIPGLSVSDGVGQDVGSSPQAGSPQDCREKAPDSVDLDFHTIRPGANQERMRRRTTKNQNTRGPNVLPPLTYVFAAVF